MTDHKLNSMEATDKLRQIIASMYQIAGAYDAPAHVLDVLANPELATQAQIDALLPFVTPQPERLSMTQQRKAFELWFRGTYANKMEWSNVSKCYWPPYVDIAWQSWQAAQSRIDDEVPRASVVHPSLQLPTRH